MTFRALHVLDILVVSAGVASIVFARGELFSTAAGWAAGRGIASMRLPIGVTLLLGALALIAIAVATATLRG